MALDPHSEQKDLSLPEDYKVDHPSEHPTDWGWHGEWGRASRIAGVLVGIVLLLMITSTQYNFSGSAWLIGIAIAILVVLVWDAQRRRHSWRKK